MFNTRFLYDEIRPEGNYKVYEIDIFDNKLETMVRESDGAKFYSSADILRMCELSNRGSYSSNLINNSEEVIRHGRKTYVDSMALFSYIFKGRNEGITKIKKKLLEFFEEKIDIQ